MDFSKTKNYLFVGSLLGVSILFLFVIKPFFYPIFWAAVIASLSYPLYRKLLKYLRSSTLSSLMTLILVTVIILLPLTGIGILLVRESISIYESINTNQGQFSQFIRDIDHFVRNNYIFSRLKLDDAFISERLSEISRSVVTFVYQFAKSLTQNSLKFVGMFVLTLYTLYYFLKDGEKMLNKIIYVFPLGNRYEKMLFDKFTSTAGATIKGTVVVGAIQGILGGILFYATGVPSPLIWGIVMAFFAAIPVTGSFLVWFPAAIIMMLTGRFVQGIIILAVGFLVISTIDNILRPMLVGKDLQMHAVIVLFATLGGVALFGLSGFIIGPVIAALCQSFWQIYEEYYNAELSKN